MMTEWIMDSVRMMLSKVQFHPSSRIGRRTRCRASALYLGKSDIEISAVGLGTLAWGDPKLGFGTRYNRDDVQDMFDEAIRLGINFFDTAEVYGYQSMSVGESSESLLGSKRYEVADPDGYTFVPMYGDVRPLNTLADVAATGGSVDMDKSMRTVLRKLSIGLCRAALYTRGVTVRKHGASPVVGSKYFTIPWTNVLVGGGIRLGRASITEALDATLKRLNMEQIDLYQIHFPFPSYSDTVLMAGLQDAIESGKARAVGVCNYNAQQLEGAHTILAAAGIPLASNQVEYSLLKRDPETNGTLDMCAQLGVTLIAHSPLKQGLLSEFALSREDESAQKIRPLLLLLKFIGALGGGKCVEQVALNYLICKGAVVIPGAKSVEQVRRNAGAMANGYRLDANELEIINEKLVSMGM